MTREELREYHKAPEGSIAASPVAHTPGPWTTFLDRSSGEDSFDILPSMRGGEIAHNIRNGADADLIRAAPELLAELKNMVEIYWGLHDDKNGDGMSPPPACIISARAAVAKAEGR